MIDSPALDRLFRTARTANGFLDRPVGEDTLRQLVDLMRMGPTSANCQPLRVVFVRSAEARAVLRPALDPGNVEKTMAAPVTAILGHDLAFHEQLPRLFPHAPQAREWFAGDAKRTARETTAFRNGTLQAGYFIMAARAVGLDCGPMSGFDVDAVNRLFFEGTSVRVNFLCNLGYADPQKVFPRGPRLEFDEICRLL